MDIDRTVVMAKEEGSKGLVEGSKGWEGGTSAIVSI